MILSDLHPALQKDIVQRVEKATRNQPLFLRRVYGFAHLPDSVRAGIVRRIGDGGWTWQLQGDDLVISGSVV